MHKETCVCCSTARLVKKSRLLRMSVSFNAGVQEAARQVLANEDLDALLCKRTSSFNVQCLEHDQQFPFNIFSYFLIL